MATNPIPTTATEIIALAGNMITGLTQLAPVLNILQVTAAGMQSELAAFTAADSAFNSARSAQQTAYDAFHTEDDALFVWLGKARAVLTTFFGNRWSPMWAQAGFINATTAVPTTINDRLGLTLRVTEFFTAHPNHEAASLGVTAAAGTTLRNAVVAGQQAVTAASTLLKQKQATRSSALDALATPMRLLIGILTSLLAADDPRWQDFGLTMPAQATAPGQPQSLTLSPSAQAITAAGAAAIDTTGNVLATCDAVPLATRYRWRTRIVGVESAYTLAASTPVPMAMLTNLPLGMAVEVIVQAVNRDRQGVASAAVIYGPAAAAATSKAVATPTAAAAETMVAQPVISAPVLNGNGSNGRHHR